MRAGRDPRPPAASRWRAVVGVPACAGCCARSGPWSSTAFFAYGIIRLLRPERYPAGESVLGGTWRDVDGRAARASRSARTSRLREECRCDGFAADLYLLAGGLVVAVGLGVAGGVWCAARDRVARPRARSRARPMFFLCTPVYVLALGTLLLFAPPFGLVAAAVLLRPATPTRRRWRTRGTSSARCSCPWLVVGAPLAGGDPAPHARADARLDGRALGAHRARQGRPAPAGRAPARRARRRTSTVLSLFGASAPIMVMNVVLVEWVFSIPGFFRHMRRALGQNYGAPRELHRHPDAAGAGDVGGGADRRRVAARRPGDRAARPAHPRGRPARALSPDRALRVAAGGAAPRRRPPARAARAPLPGCGDADDLRERGREAAPARRGGARPGGALGDAGGRPRARGARPTSSASVPQATRDDQAPSSGRQAPRGLPDRGAAAPSTPTGPAPCAPRALPRAARLVPLDPARAARARSGLRGGRGRERGVLLPGRRHDLRRRGARGEHPARRPAAASPASAPATAARAATSGSPT